MCTELVISPDFKMVEANENSERHLLYGYHEICEASKAVACLLSRIRNSLIIVAVPKSAVIVPIIFGIMKSNNVFMCITPSNVDFIMKERDRYNARCLVSLDICSEIYLTIFISKVFFTIFDANELPIFHNLKNCYVIQTSGTTGEPKEVIVPYTAIMPNILDFSVRFNISASDVILFGTALTFDPSIVELFLAAQNGCSLLVVPDDVRVRPSLYGAIIANYAVTFVQTTPSLLMLLPPTVLRQMFAPTSSLRVLLIGGELFPLTFLRKYCSMHSKTTIYNVYGITEVSCWASCRRVDYASLMQSSEMDIGDPIRDTLLDVSDTNELLIRGRACIVNRCYQNNWTATGDLAKLDKAGRIYICGRLTEQIIKLNGVRLNLGEIEARIAGLDGVDSCAVLNYKEGLILFLKSNLASIESVKKFLPPIWQCHAILKIEEWPVTKHGNCFVGKLDRQALLQWFWKSKKVATLNDVPRIFKDFDIDIQTDYKETFASLGFTSFKATELMLQIEHLVVEPEFSVVQYVLSTNGTIEGLLSALGCKDNIDLKPCFLPFLEESLMILERDKQSVLCWQEHMEKCIDSTPVINKNFVIVGSHSGRLVSLALEDGKLLWEKRLGGRIEGTVAVGYGTVVVGCYDHHAYFLNEENGETLWKFKTGDVIKSTAKFVSDGRCLVTSHDKWIRLLDYKNRTQIWSTFCGGSILASVIFHDDAVICSTLAGSILSIRKKTGEMVSEARCKAPFFAAPCLTNNNNGSKLIACDVSGNVYSMDARCLLQDDIVRIHEPVFASPIMVSKNCGILVTQHSSIFFFGTKPLSILRHLATSTTGQQSTFVRSPVLLDNIIFLLNTSGQLLAIKPIPTATASSLPSPSSLSVNSEDGNGDWISEIQNFEKKYVESQPNAASVIQTLSIRAHKIVSVTGETFGGATIVKCENNKNDCCNVTTTTAVSTQCYRALIGSRDEHIRCFVFTIQNNEFQ